MPLLTEVAISKGKLIINIAENGTSLVAICDETTAVEAVMRYVESVSGIVFTDQIVLCFGIKLEPSRLLRDYKLPSLDKEVFVFNKEKLQSNCPLPPIERVPILEAHDPEMTGGGASDPTLKPVLCDERELKFLHRKCHAIYRRTLSYYENCEKLLREQKVQEKALLVGRNNVEQYFLTINQSFKEFTKRYTYQNKANSSLLMKIFKEIDEIKTVPLHPSLRTSSTNSLLDLIDEEALINLKNCENSHLQFEKKVAEFQQMFEEVKGKIEEVLSWRLPFSLENLEMMINENQRFIDEQKIIVNNMGKDANTVKSYQQRMTKYERSISKLLEFCVHKKNDMNRFVHTYMQKITYISYIIKDAKLQFPVFNEAMMREDDLFSGLSIVGEMISSYRACFTEAMRRKAWKKSFMDLINHFTDNLTAKRLEELVQREEFTKRITLRISKDALSSLGLCDSPGLCEIKMPSFDRHLVGFKVHDFELKNAKLEHNVSLACEKCQRLNEIEIKYNSVVEENSKLCRELETFRKLVKGKDSQKEAKAEHGGATATKEREDELLEKCSKMREKQKQMSKEMVRVSDVQLREKALFVLNSTGHYEAVATNSANYYLSSSSVELFMDDRSPSPPRFIIGLVVHIEKQIANVGPASCNPYHLPIGCQYFVVTVAIIP